MNQLIRKIMAEGREAMLDYQEVNEDEFLHDYAEIVLSDEEGLHSPKDVADAKEFFGIS